MQSQRRVQPEDNPPGRPIWPGEAAYWDVSTGGPNPWAPNASFEDLMSGLPIWPASHGSFAPLVPPSLPRHDVADFISANVEDQMTDSPVALEQQIFVKSEPELKAETEARLDGVPDQSATAMPPPGRHPVSSTPLTNEP